MSQLPIYTGIKLKSFMKADISIDILFSIMQKLKFA